MEMNWEEILDEYNVKVYAANSRRYLIIHCDNHTFFIDTNRRDEKSKIKCPNIEAAKWYAEGLQTKDNNYE